MRSPKKVARAQINLAIEYLAGVSFDFRNYLAPTSRSLVILALLLLVVAGGAAMETFLGADAADTRQRVISRIPIGSTLSDAQATMEANGFHCVQMKGARFTADNPGDPQTSHGPADFLWCDSGERVAGVLVSKRWQVVLTHKDGIVTQIFASVSLTGP